MPEAPAALELESAVRLALVAVLLDIRRYSGYALTGQERPTSELLTAIYVLADLAHNIPQALGANTLHPDVFLRLEVARLLRHRNEHAWRSHLRNFLRICRAARRSAAATLRVELQEPLPEHLLLIPGREQRCDGGRQRSDSLSPAAQEPTSSHPV